MKGKYFTTRWKAIIIGASQAVLYYYRHEHTILPLCMMNPIFMIFIIMSYLAEFQTADERKESSAKAIVEQLLVTVFGITSFVLKRKDTAQARQNTINLIFTWYSYVGDLNFDGRRCVSTFTLSNDEMLFNFKCLFVLNDKCLWSRHLYKIQILLLLCDYRLCERLGHWMNDQRNDKWSDVVI